MTLHEKFERYIKTLEVIYSLEYQINNPVLKPLERSLISERNSDPIHLFNELRPAKALEELKLDLLEKKKKVSKRTSDRNLYDFKKS